MTREETARHPTPDLITHPTGRLFIPRNPASCRSLTSFPLLSAEGLGLRHEALTSLAPVCDA